MASFVVPRKSPTIRRPCAMVSSIASSSARRTGLLCGTIGPSSAMLIRFTCAAMNAADRIGDGVKIRGE